MRACRVDANQKTIVEALRGVGATVTHTHMVGKGFVDIVVGYRRRNYLLEIKDPSQPKSKRVLTPDEKEWHDTWRGNAYVVETVSEALLVIGATK
jgi:hypothetical protein